MLIWPGDLVFDPRCSSFELDLEIIKTNILSQIHDDCFKNVTARVLTRNSADQYYKVLKIHVHNNKV